MLDAYLMQLSHKLGELQEKSWKEEWWELICLGSDFSSSSFFDFQLPNNFPTFKERFFYMCKLHKESQIILSISCVTRHLSHIYLRIEEQKKKEEEEEKIRQA